MFILDDEIPNSENSDTRNYSQNGNEASQDAYVYSNPDITFEENKTLAIRGGTERTLNKTLDGKTEINSLF